MWGYTKTEQYHQINPLRKKDQVKVLHNLVVKSQQILALTQNKS